MGRAKLLRIRLSETLHNCADTRTTGYQYVNLCFTHVVRFPGLPREREEARQVISFRSGEDSAQLRLQGGLGHWWLKLCFTDMGTGFFAHELTAKARGEAEGTLHGGLTRPFGDLACGEQRQ